MMTFRIIYSRNPIIEPPFVQRPAEKGVNQRENQDFTCSFQECVKIRVQKKFTEWVLGNFENMGLLVYRFRAFLSFGSMPKRKLAPPLGPSKRKYVAILKAVKNEIREMIKAGFSKSQVEEMPQLIQIENQVNEPLDDLHIESEKKVLLSKLFFADSYICRLLRVLLSQQVVREKSKLISRLI